MKKIISVIASIVLAGGGILVFALPTIASADTVNANFESPTYTIGNINGVDGWSATGSVGNSCGNVLPYDEGVSSSNSTAGFGSQSFRISNAVTSGCFGDQAFSKPLTDSAGETGSDPSGFPQGTLQPHFESQFSIAAIPNSIGDIMSVSPDTGNGGRMSYLRFDNESDGVHVYFDDVQGTSNPANFVETQIALLSNTAPHTVRFSMDFVNGPSNDVVKIYLDGNLAWTGTSWENYYRFDSESNLTLNNAFTHSVRSMEFRASSDPAVPGNAGKGFLIDNLSLFSGTVNSTGQLCTDVTLTSGTNTLFKGLTTTDPLLSDLVSLFTGGIPGSAVADGPDGFPGAWNTAANDPTLAGAVFVSNMVTAPSNPAGTGDGQDGTVNVWRLFTQGFSIPAGATVSSATLHFTADNSVNAFLDNNLVGSATDFNTVAAASPVITAGAHELEFVVKNDAFDGTTNPTGLIYKATVNYCVAPPPSTVCPAAPSIAASLLKLHSVKANSSSNFISSVAHQMGPQTLFNSVDACNTAAYTAAVNTFLIGLGAYH